MFNTDYNKAQIIPLNPVPNIQASRVSTYKTVSIMPKTINIKALGRYPSNVLSNFCETSFTLDGVKINSIEGFLQSLKTDKPELQKQICQMSGSDAKKMSKSLKQSDNDILLHWKNKVFTRGSDDYKQLKQAVIKASQNAGHKSFKFQGVEISSIASFLLSLKTGDKVLQEKIRTISTDADLRCISQYIKPEYAVRKLHWNGKTFKRDSKEYKDLLLRVYNARYNSDFEFRQALRATKGLTLTHSKGKSDIHKTVLTKDEFLEILDSLRSKKDIKIEVSDFFRRVYKYISKGIKYL